MCDEAGVKWKMLVPVAWSGKCIWLEIPIFICNLYKESREEGSVPLGKNFGRRESNPRGAGLIHVFMENRRIDASFQESKDAYPLNRLLTSTERAREKKFAKQALSARQMLQYPFNTTSITNRAPFQEWNDLPQVQRDLAAPIICLCSAADVPLH
jgi:hypothetical protein